MSRIDEILSFEKPKAVFDAYGLESALCSCLAADEACELLLLCAVERLDLRRGILRKVCADIDQAELQCHLDLIESLKEKLLNLGYKASQSLGYCLSEISLHVSPKIRRNIQNFFLCSRYISVRRRGYKSVGKEENCPESDVLIAWESFKDPECAWTIAKAFPISFLLEHRAELLAHLTEGWQFSRLYLRIGAERPEFLTELKEINEISYCYVLAKLGRTLPEKEAEAIISNNAADENFGMLVWSLGKMQNWSALQHIKSNLEQINNAQSAAIFARAGVQQRSINQ